MCGIYGQIAPREAPTATIESLHHRGPDDTGIEVFGVCGTHQLVSLLHKRLAILDLSPAGHQPMSNEDGTVWITFNGEIYNFVELREDLKRAGHVFRSHTDTETIVHGYEEWGEQVVPRLRGMFAFALWDSRKKQMLLARDRIGKKPLFYHFEDGLLLFGSEIKSLLASGEVQPELDAESLHDYLTYLYYPAPRTAFRGISKLPPATCMMVTVNADGSLKQRPWEYWDALESEVEVPKGQAQFERLRELMEEAIGIRLVSDVPLGLTLSGGMDSSSITALVARRRPERIRTFTVGFADNKHYDELATAEFVARTYGTDHHVLNASATCAGNLTTVVEHFDEPFGNPTAILQYILTRLMREHVTVALTGDGGDEAFGGYPRYLGAKLAGLYRGLPRMLTRGLVARLASHLSEANDGRHSSRRVREFLEYGWQAEEDSYLRWVGYFTTEEKLDLYTPEFAAQVGSRDSSEFLRTKFRRGAKLDPVNRIEYVDLSSFLACNCLEYGDRMSMANSLELRCPFTDHRLLEYALRMKGNTKIHGTEMKWGMKQAMSGVLPEQLLRNKKIGFNPPLPQWIEGELKPLIAFFLSPAAITRRGYFRPAPVLQLIEEHRTGRRDNGLKIWSLLMVELWARMYLDREPRAGLDAEISQCITTGAK